MPSLQHRTIYSILLTCDLLLNAITSTWNNIFNFRLYAIDWFSRNNESKGSSIWVNIAYILHGTIYSIFAYYMWTIQSNFRNLITSTTNVHRTWKNFIRHSTLAEKNIFVSIYSTTWPWCMELNPHRIFFCCSTMVQMIQQKKWFSIV